MFSYQMVVYSMRLLVNSYFQTCLFETKHLAISFEFAYFSANTFFVDGNKHSSINASNTNIIIGGDFNLGHIDWSIPQVIPCNPETELNIKLLDIIDENNLHQIVKLTSVLIHSLLMAISTPP
jgi:hypothetical protein